ncbi:MAG TPA: DoxX family protein [Candidatus Angelobacter sp.]|nr:DoxX family protein [Candidatus Angelobacter sp.]
MLTNLGLLLIRVFIGFTFIGHGGQKLFAWFGGGGPRGTAEWFESMGVAPRRPIWAIIAGAFEFVGGLLFGAGVLTAVGAALISIIMLDAIITVHAKNGYWVSNNGFEYPLITIITVVGIAMIGPGEYVLYSFS